ncbi:MAG: hypothetical protein IJV91_10240, partial [Kiritimatiellae bacterium]|nr:hypothetical protein [Kiritimatiellia bacterium]
MFSVCFASRLSDWLYLRARPCRFRIPALDMGGKWSVRGEGVFGDAVLPGTLADSALGREQSYETWNAVSNKQERYALRLQHQYVGEAVWSRRVTVPASLAAKPL